MTDEDLKNLKEEILENVKDLDSINDCTGEEKLVLELIEFYEQQRRAVQPEEVQRHIQNIERVKKDLKENCISGEFWDKERDDEVISQLKSIDLAITALRQMQWWIPVSERLPEVGNFVLIYNSYSPEEYETLSIGMIYQPSDGRRKPYWKWLAHRKDSFYLDWICPGEEYVTHWMPLPEPPKEET